MDKSKRYIIVIAAILIFGILITAILATILFLPIITSSFTRDTATNDSQLSMVTADPLTTATATFETTATLRPAPTSTPTSEETVPPPSQTISPTPTLQEIPAEIASQMDRIEDEVIGLRTLQSTGPVSRSLLSRDQLRQKIEDDYFEDYSAEEAQEDVIVLSAFGLLEPGFDMMNFYQDLLGEVVAGRYDDETMRMDVVQGTSFGGNERLTYAHEYAHALQDQNFDLESGLMYSDEACEEEAERCAAVQALIEGDASFLELEWFYNYATPEDVIDIQDFYRDYESPIYDSAPEYLKMDFTFPYDYGFTFVEYLYTQGDWEAVNSAFLNPPVTTEQILHPERYPDDKPIDVNLPDLTEQLGDGWAELDRGIMGEWYTFLILAAGINSEARLDEATAQAASDGWGGDVYVVFYDQQNDDTVLVMLTSWESVNDANQFFAAFQDHSTTLFGTPEIMQGNQIGWAHEDGFTNIHKQDNFTSWIMAPDKEIAQNIWNSILLDLET